MWGSASVNLCERSFPFCVGCETSFVWRMAIVGYIFLKILMFSNGRLLSEWKNDLVDLMDLVDLVGFVDLVDLVGLVDLIKRMCCLVQAISSAKSRQEEIKRKKELPPRRIAFSPFRCPSLTVRRRLRHQLLCRRWQERMPSKFAVVRNGSGLHAFELCDRADLKATILPTVVLISG